ncbi:MAG: hypothetical protein M3Z14_03435, partial [Candidatus Eremiobacteraeota bacterium]|nr:hypothetical protein [Candidatus Eremiobacteraeota bacterium]
LDNIAVAALEQRDAAAQEVGAAEHMVRSQLCANLRVHSGTLRDAAKMLGEIDVFLAKVQFAKENAGCVPRFSDTTLIEFTQARFLPLVTQLQSQNRKYIPISLRVQGVALLSGPNMGGKSVALRTCGFLTLCASLGLPVPAARAKLVLFKEIVWIGVGIDEGPAGLLSAFAKEVVRLSELLVAKREPGLILIDEFARTTNPREGRALLLALIQTLRGRNVCALVATHLPGIAEKAGVPHFAVRGLHALPQELSPRNLDEALALLATSMDYSISEVAQDAVGRADAIALAQILGLDQELVAAARKAL